MGVNQLFIDPVPAAFGQLLHIQFAGGEHHLAQIAIDLIAIDVDIGKVVVGADFLNLTQSVLQCLPIPQPDVLQSGLIICRICRAHGRLRGKLALRETVQSVCLARHKDVVRNVGLLAYQFIRFDDKAAHPPAGHANAGKTERRGQNRRHQPASSRHRHGVCRGSHRPGDQRHAYQQQAAKRDMGVGVGDTAEDRMIVEQKIKPAEIDTHRQDQQKERKGDGEPAPRNGEIAAAAGKRTRSAGDENEENGQDAGDDGQRKQPAGDQLPGRQGKEKEVQRLAKNRVDHAAHGGGRVPESARVGHSAIMPAPVTRAITTDPPKRDQAHHRVDREPHWLSAEENSVTAG